jgi:hypothetical protein
MRIEKHFIISYYEKDDPMIKHDISQIKNISLGGMCFVSAQSYAPSTKIGIDMRTPYLTDTVPMEGTVLESREKIRNMIYETRLVFDKLSEQAELIIKKLIATFAKI